MNELKVAIDRPFHMLDSAVTFYYKLGQGKVNALQADGSYKEFSTGQLIKPTFTLPHEAGPLLLQALLDKGVTAPSHSFISGQIEALRDHMKDLRTLLKLK